MEENIKRIKELVTKIEPISMENVEDEEAEALNRAKFLTSKAIKDYLMEIVKEKLKEKNHYKKVKELIETLGTPDYTEYNKFCFRGKNTDFKLGIQVSTVDEIDVIVCLLAPIDAFSTIFKEVSRTMKLTDQYYQFMMYTNQGLYNMLRNYISDIDFSQLKIDTDTYKTTFHPNPCKKVIAPIFYYIHEDGSMTKAGSFLNK